MADERPGGEPTEEATPRRLEKARERGEIARSGDFTSAAAFAAGCGAVIALMSQRGSELTSLVRRGIAGAVEPSPLSPGAVLACALTDLARLSAPVLVAPLCAALLVGGLQAGGLFTWLPLAPKGSRLDPLAGLKRTVSRDSLAQLLRSLAKLTAIAAVAWWTLAPHVGELVRLSLGNAAGALGWIGGIAARLLLRVAAVYLVIGGADYLWQRRSHARRLRMTRDEVRREHKESEGDPRHKAERQRLHRDLLRHQMIEAVRNADCVIVNPEHLAVALSFDDQKMGAPQVVAKGERLVAQQIKEVARQFGVPIYRDVALARSLAELELGDEIPAELYDAVAEVLRWAYRWREHGG